jgi:O-succinylbenzoic acid--CoA ligase
MFPANTSPSRCKDRAPDPMPSTAISGSLPDFLDASARAFPDQEALVFAAKRWTFSGMRRGALAAGALLGPHRAELRGGARIGILSASRPGYVFAVFAAARMGVAFVPLNTRLSAPEIAWQVADADIGLLIADEAHRGPAESLANERGCALLAMEEIEAAPPWSPADVEPSRFDLSRDAAVLYTSGTSGRPKGARITFGNLWSSAVASSLYLGHRRDDVWLATLPLFHIGGLSMLFRGAIGATPVILHERFDPEAVNAAIDDGATLVSLVPAMLSRLIGERGERPWPGHLRCVLLGGSATPRPLLEEALRRGIPIAPTYGLTESASQATTLLPDQTSRKPGSSGLPLPVTDLRIAIDGSPVASRAIGQIELRGPTIFAGYLRQEGGATENDGWFATGDDGYLDDDGYLYVVDRRRDLIVSGGENIYPAEIERVLLEHPLVADAGVVGLPSRAWGERPVAVVAWRGDPGEAELAVIDHCSTRLGRYKVPARVIVWSSLPRSASGKLSRHRLREAIAAKLPELD